MKYFFSLLALVLTLSFVPTDADAARKRSRPSAATCTGSTPCRACKNSKYCKHCAEDGGKCSTCKNRKEAARSWDAAIDGTHH